MKSIYGTFAGAVALTFSLAACIPAAAPPPSPAPSPPRPAAPAPAQVVEPTPVPAPMPIVAPAIAENWADQPQTRGDWIYERESSETFAVFGDGRAEPKAIIRCDLRTRNIGIGQFGELSAAEAPMLVRTETQSRTLRAITRDSGAPLYAAELAANDALFDAIALTRGRFALAVAGKPALYLPAWGEVTRVIEDCR